jgi:hypothetical protein
VSIKEGIKESSWSKSASTFLNFSRRREQESRLEFDFMELKLEISCSALPPVLESVKKARAGS